MDEDDMHDLFCIITWACIEGMDIDDLWECAQYAKSLPDLDLAVNTLAQTMPELEEIPE